MCVYVYLLDVSLNLGDSLLRMQDPFTDSFKRLKEGEWGDREGEGTIEGRTPFLRVSATVGRGGGGKNGDDGSTSWMKRGVTNQRIRAKRLEIDEILKVRKKEDFSE
jgi:hypothetical protein